MKRLLDAGFTVGILANAINPQSGKYRACFYKDMLIPKERTVRREWDHAYFDSPDDLPQVAEKAADKLLGGANGR